MILWTFCFIFTLCILFFILRSVLHVLYIRNSYAKCAVCITLGDSKRDDTYSWAAFRVFLVGLKCVAVIHLLCNVHFVVAESTHLNQNGMCCCSPESIHRWNTVSHVCDLLGHFLFEWGSFFFFASGHIYCMSLYLSRVHPWSLSSRVNVVGKFTRPQWAFKLSCHFHGHDLSLLWGHETWPSVRAGTVSPGGLGGSLCH